jgi:hypothetical protein
MDSMPTSPATPPRVNAYPPVVRHLDFGLVVIDLTTIARNRPRTDRYFVERLDCDDLAYSLTKTDPVRVGTDSECECYAVNLSMSTCDCKGWHRWGACKHLAGCREAYEEGRLP